MVNTLSKTILFIPGAFLATDCWNDWKSYFEQKGYTTIAAPWPHKNAPPESLRNNDIENTIASVRLTELLDYYTAIVRSLPDTPILIGHSVGGLIVQSLLQRGLGAAGIALHSFPPRRTSPFPFSFIRAWWEPMGFFFTRERKLPAPLQRLETLRRQWNGWRIAKRPLLPLRRTGIKTADQRPLHRPGTNKFFTPPRPTPPGLRR
jgi:pimeloyl-ACP methyl ester carboxylesterase